jgi:hypothetical protein
MSLVIRKIGDNLYEAKTTPPHAGAAWSTAEPVPGRRLIAELLRQGCHQQDIGDALSEQDREWLDKLEPMSQNGDGV